MDMSLHTGTQGGQKRAVDSLGLGLQAIVNHFNVGAGNETLIL